jgi:hypothetical protein
MGAELPAPISQKRAPQSPQPSTTLDSPPARCWDLYFVCTASELLSMELPCRHLSPRSDPTWAFITLGAVKSAEQSQDSSQKRPITYSYPRTSLWQPSRFFRFLETTAHHGSARPGKDNLVGVRESWSWKPRTTTSLRDLLSISALITYPKQECHRLDPTGVRISRSSKPLAAMGL